jgi:glycosyltransferase involved in cell wall biosynthesis
VVAAASGQVSELVSSAGAGLVCPPEDATAVADAIRRLAGDDELAREMGENGRRYAEQHLSRVAMVDRLQREIERLLERQSVALEPATSS